MVAVAVPDWDVSHPEVAIFVTCFSETLSKST
jgi:hypothetical protein